MRLHALSNTFVDVLVRWTLHKFRFKNFIEIQVFIPKIAHQKFRLKFEFFTIIIYYIQKK
jgi:hypothetical protein